MAGSGSPVWARKAVRRCPFSLFRRLDDRVVAAGVEAPPAPGLLHVRGERRGDVEGAAAGMRDSDAASEQMQLVLHAARQLPVLDAEVFLVTHDWVADMLHMRPELVGAAGDRLERQPRELLRRG